jgi:hypothetical protein
VKIYRIELLKNCHFTIVKIPSNISDIYLTVTMLHKLWGLRPIGRGRVGHILQVLQAAAYSRFVAGKHIQV